MREYALPPTNILSRNLAESTSFCDSEVKMDRLYLEPQMFAVLSYFTITGVFFLLGVVCFFHIINKHEYEEDLESDDDDNDDVDDAYERRLAAEEITEMEMGFEDKATNALHLFIMTAVALYSITTYFWYTTKTSTRSCFMQRGLLLLVFKPFTLPFLYCCYHWVWLHVLFVGSSRACCYCRCCAACCSPQKYRKYGVVEKGRKKYDKNFLTKTIFYVTSAALLVWIVAFSLMAIPLMLNHFEVLIITLCLHILASVGGRLYRTHFIVSRGHRREHERQMTVYRSVRTGYAFFLYVLATLYVSPYVDDYDKPFMQGNAAAWMAQFSLQTREVEAFAFTDRNDHFCGVSWRKIERSFRYSPAVPPSPLPFSPLLPYFSLSPLASPLRLSTTPCSY
jgi:hypothetical protein